MLKKVFRNLLFWLPVKELNEVNDVANYNWSVL